MSLKISVIGLGYVGLPLALELAKHFPTLGFDINEEKVDNLRKGIDVTREGYDDALKQSKLVVTARIEDLSGSNFFIVGVPTPIDINNNPDLTPLLSACDLVGSVLAKGAIVVFESTVYPGLTEEICGPRLAAASGLKAGVDFKLGYSPERINPGDPQHSLTRVVKVISAEDEQTLEALKQVYGSIITAGVHAAPSIKVAEAAKVIENTQRDLNIALMNELAIIFDRMGVATRDVLSAAGTKWNFLKFTPGLVGGHCIGVDPYYLTTKAELLKYHPQVILAGRRINDGMGTFIAQKAVKLLLSRGLSLQSVRVAILGVTFKENVADIRNSRVPGIAQELEQYGMTPIIHDPIAESDQVQEEYGVKLSNWSELTRLDCVILAVSHKQYLAIEPSSLFSMLNRPGVFIDVKSVMDRSTVPEQVIYWSL